MQRRTPAGPGPLAEFIVRPVEQDRPVDLPDTPREVLVGYVNSQRAIVADDLVAAHEGEDPARHAHEPNAALVGGCDQRQVTDHFVVKECIAGHLVGETREEVMETCAPQTWIS